MRTTTLFLIFLSVSMYGQNKIQPLVEFDGGYGNVNSYQYYEQYDQHFLKIDKSSFYSNLILGASFKNFSLRTETATYFYPASQHFGFVPWFADYKIEFSYTFRKITFGINHDCKHLIKTKTLEPIQYGGGSEHIYFKWKIK